MPVDKKSAAPLASNTLLIVLMNETPFANCFRLKEQPRVRGDVPNLTYFQC
jgi:hypothetical protein